MSKLVRGIKDNSGIIFSALSIAGLVGTCIMAVKGALTADKLIDPDLDKEEKIKVYAKSYAGAAICGAGTIACILGANHVHLRKEAALAGVAALWKTDLTKLDEKVKEKFGLDKAKEIHHEIIKDKMKENLPMQMPVPDGQILVYEPYTDQYINTSREKIANAMYKANEKLAKEFDVRLNYIIGLLGGTMTKEGDLIGWNWENENQDYAWSYYGGPWITMLTSVTTDKDGKDALCLFYEVDPDTQEPEQMIYYEK